MRDAKEFAAAWLKLRPRMTLPEIIEVFWISAQDAILDLLELQQDKALFNSRTVQRRKTQVSNAIESYVAGDQDEGNIRDCLQDLYSSLANISCLPAVHSIFHQLYSMVQQPEANPFTVWLLLMQYERPPFYA